MTSRPIGRLRSMIHSEAKVLIFLVSLLLPGCAMDQELHERLTQSLDESAQIRARQSQEISALREQELPELHGELERVLHQTQELQGTQEDLKQRMLVLEQLVGKGGRLLTERTNPPEKDSEARLETHEDLISSLLIQVNDLSKRLKAIEKQE